jgi:hypothetical protein
MEGIHIPYNASITFIPYISDFLHAGSGCCAVYTTASIVQHCLAKNAVTASIPHEGTNVSRGRIPFGSVNIMILHIPYVFVGYRCC